MNYGVQVFARIVMFCIGFAIALGTLAGSHRDPAEAMAVGVLGGIIGVVAANRWFLR